MDPTSAAQPDCWGCLEADVEVMASETMRRLDAEEADAGFEPW